MVGHKESVGKSVLVHVWVYACHSPQGQEQKKEENPHSGTEGPERGEDAAVSSTCYAEQVGAAPPRRRTMSCDLDMLRDRIAGLKTPAACEQFAKNVEANGKPEAALLARKRAIELHAQSHGALSDAEREALEAVYAYERTLFLKHGKHVRATRT